MYNKLISTIFLCALLSATPFIIGMENNVIKSGHRFLTPFNDEASWNKIDQNGESSDSGFKNITPYGSPSECEIEHISGNQYQFTSTYCNQPFSITMTDAQRNKIESMCKNHQEVYVYLFKNNNNPPKGVYIYPIDKIKPHQKTSSPSLSIIPQELPSDNQLPSTVHIKTVNSQQSINKIEKELQTIDVIKKTKTNSNPPKKSFFKTIFTFNNGIRFSVAAIIIYLIYSGKMNQLLSVDSLGS